jgi:cyclic-di-GMP-binding biofilm dispersal mediator protein
MKKALVTGSASGLGAALAHELTTRGYKVVGVDRNEPTTSAVSQSVICDLSSRDDLDAMLPSIIAAGPYELVFMNAGISATGKFESISMQAQLAVLQVNLEAPLVMTNALLKADSLQGGICFISSLSHFTGYPGAATYAASKDGLVAYANSLRKAGIKTTLTFPGPLDTPHAEQHAPQGSSAERRMKPDVAAQKIVDAVIAGKNSVTPGFVAKISSLVGRLFPHSVTKIMRKALYEKLDRNVL